MAGVTAADVDIVLLATSSPDDIFGSASQARPSSLQPLFRGLLVPPDVRGAEQSDREYIAS